MQSLVQVRRLFPTCHVRTVSPPRTQQSPNSSSSPLAMARPAPKYRSG
jgi:hypothetical protein